MEVISDEEIRISYINTCKESGRDDEIVGARGVAKAQLEACKKDMAGIKSIIQDYYHLPGINFIEKYSIDGETYWNGEDGEGLWLAIKQKYLGGN